jgi:hypothetical protein
MLDLGSRSCTAAPNLQGAAELAYVPDKARPQTVKLDETSPCYTGEDGKPHVYAIFALPAAEQPFIISVASTPQGEALFPPHIQLLNEAGALARDIPDSLFLFRGFDMSAELRSHPAEHFLLVRSNSDLVGKKLSRISANVTMTSTGYANIYSGADVTTNLTFSYSGQLTVVLLPITAPKR